MASTVGNEMEVIESAINPFAVAEAISEKKISWGDDFDAQKKKLSSTLGISEEDIFGDNSPFLHPGYAVKGHRKLSILEAKKQMKDFLDTKLVNTPVNLKKSLASEKKRTLASAKRDLIMKAIFVEESPNPKDDYTPDNCTWNSNGIFYKCAPEVDDPIQGSLGDCYFIASIAATAWAKPYSILNRASIAYCDTTGDVESNITHEMEFFSAPKNSDYSSKKLVDVTDLIPLNTNTKRPIYARSNDEGETWPSVYEKAYVKYRTGHTGEKPYYPFIAGGYAGETIGEVTGGKVTVKRTSSTSASDIIKFIQSNCNSWTLNDYWGKDGYSHRLKNPMVAGGTVSNSYGIIAGHAYSVLGFDYEDGQYYVVLRNPWGSSPATKDVKSGFWNVISYRKGYGSSIPLNVTNPSQRWSGIFALKVESFIKAFGYIAASAY